MAVAAPEHLVITTDSVGGIWRYCIDLAGELARRGTRVTLAGLGPAPSPGQLQEAALAGVELVWLEAPLDWMTAGQEGAELGAAALDRLLRKRQPSLLHLNAPPLAPYLTSAVPRLVAAHSCLATWWDSMRNQPLPVEWHGHARAMARGLRAADVVVAPTAAFAEAMRCVYGSLPSIRVVPNASRPITPAESKEQFVFAAGRWWDEAKNLACLDAAAQEISWPLQVAGPLHGPQSSAPKPAHLVCLGSLDHDDIARWLARTPIFVSPARYEPFGLAVLEAASAGAALVLADIPTFRELWSHSALLLDPQLPEVWSQAVNRLIEKPDLREEMGRRAQQRAEAFTLARQADRMLDAYGEAMAARFRAPVNA